MAVFELAIREHQEKHNNKEVMNKKILLHWYASRQSVKSKCRKSTNLCEFTMILRFLYEESKGKGKEVNEWCPYQSVYDWCVMLVNALGAKSRK